MATIQCFNEWITLAEAHVLLGTTAPADDVKVRSMIDSIDAMIVSYAGRNLKHCEHIDTIYRPCGSFVKIDNWPIVTIVQILTDGSATSETEFDIDQDLGLLYFATTGITFAGVQPKKITVQYEGGYEPVPLELQVMFQTLLKSRNDAGGAAAVGGVGEIKKVSLTGVAAVEFATGGSSVSYSGVDRLTGVPEELKPYVGILDPYRSDKMVSMV